MFAQLLALQIENKERERVDLDQLVGMLLQENISTLLSSAIKDLDKWFIWLIEIENYLSLQMLEVVEEVVDDVDAISPIGRYQILLALAGGKASKVDYSKIVIRYGRKLKKNVEPLSFQERSKLIVKGMHRSALIYSIQWAHRLADEKKIISHNIDTNDIALLTAHYQSAVIVFDTLRKFINQLEYAELMSHYFEDKAKLQEYLPPMEAFREATEATVALFKSEGIFLSVVVKTLEDQQNPYQLITYSRDLVILYDLLQKYKSQLTEQKIRDRVAEEARQDDLQDRFNEWIYFTAQMMAKRNELNTPFAKKFKLALVNGLGTGKLIKSLQVRLAKVSAKQKDRMRYLVTILLQAEVSNLVGLSVAQWSEEMMLLTESEDVIDIDALFQLMTRKGYQMGQIDSKNKYKLKELFQIVQLIQKI